MISERIGKKHLAWNKTDKTDYLISYNTIIAFHDKENNKSYSTDKRYSRTTTKHFNQFYKLYPSSKLKHVNFLIELENQLIKDNTSYQKIIYYANTKPFDVSIGDTIYFIN